MIRRLALGLLVALSLVLAPFAWWCAVPLHDPPRWAALQQEWKQAQAGRKAIPASSNGWNPSFEWPPLEVVNLDRLAEPHYPALDEEFDLEKVGRSLDNGAVRSALAAAAPRCAGLPQALDKPYYVAAFPQVTSRSEFSSYLVCLAALRYREGKRAEAFRLARLNFAWGFKLLGWGDREVLESALEVEHTARGLMLALAGSGQLDESQLRELQSALRDLTVEPGQFLASMDGDLFFCLDRLMIDCPWPGRIPLLNLFYRHRERNLMVNYFLDRRTGWKSWRDGPPDPPPSAYDVAWYANDQREGELMLGLRMMGADLAALKLIAAVELGRLEKGRYPARLPGSVRNPDAPFRYTRGPNGYRLENSSAEHEFVGRTERTVFHD